jgi:hypothetical protein
LTLASGRKCLSTPSGEEVLLEEKIAYITPLDFSTVFEVGGVFGTGLCSGNSEVNGRTPYMG